MINVYVKASILAQVSPFQYTLKSLVTSRNKLIFHFENPVIFVVFIYTISNEY